MAKTECTSLPRHPFIFEINTWPWLEQLRAREGRLVDLGSVPRGRWCEIADSGFDAVWLMGVWERSPAGIALALRDSALVSSFVEALPDFAREDVVGSPYCVHGYEVDQHLGGRAALEAAREVLADLGVSLILDFVPNHVAPDHPWTVTHPERFVLGNRDELRDDPASFVEVNGRVLANGRDPYFPAWPDVVQLNAFSADLRAAVVDTLRSIGDQCDGVRCDMAMLMLNDTFERTWGARAGDRPAEDFWPAIIGAVRSTHPRLTFIAEAYWDLESALLEQGFDYCYDKRLYDRLLHERAEDVRQHLLADPAYQQHLLRFIENHDEPRAASVLDRSREKAVAVATLTQTGARLVHNGQDEARRVHLPVFLRRFPDEPADDDVRTFYASLEAALCDDTFRSGAWQLCDRWGWEGDERHQNLLAWCWTGEHRWLVVVNLSDDTAAGLVRAPWDDLRGVACRLVDPTNDVTYDRDGSTLCDGMYIELGPWSWHLFDVRRAAEVS